MHGDTHLLLESSKNDGQPRLGPGMDPPGYDPGTYLQVQSLPVSEPYLPQILGYRYGWYPQVYPQYLQVYPDICAI
jgi:hypothetical protein